MSNKCMMHRIKPSFVLIVFLFELIFLIPTKSFAVDDPEVQLSEVGVVNHLGEHIDFTAKFTDTSGREQSLRELAVKDRPLIIVPAYFGCPRLCGLVLDGVVELLNSLTLVLGKDFTVVTVSFDPDDTPARALDRENSIKAKLKPELDKSAWHFLVGSKENTSALMEKLGFRFKKDGADFSHTAAIFFLTPRGELSQYLAGITFDPKVSRLMLVDSSQGTVGTAFDQAFLFCFRYDHLAGKYVWISYSIMRLGGVLTLSFLIFLIYRLRRRELAARKGLATSLNN